MYFETNAHQDSKKWMVKMIEDNKRKRIQTIHIQLGNVTHN